MIRRLGWSLGCVLALGAGGCGGNGGTDAGFDAGPPPEFLEVVTAMDPDGTPTAFGPADFSCRGSQTAPAGSGAAVAFDVEAESFGAPGAPVVEGLTVRFYPDNVIPLDGSCTGTCMEVMTGAGGIASVMDVEGSWYAYSILAGSGTAEGTPTDFIDVVQYNEQAPAAAGSSTVFAVSETTQDSIITLLGGSRVAGTSVVTGQLFDCNGDAVQHAHVRVFDADGEITLGEARFDPVFSFYFNGEQFPRSQQRDTNYDGLYGAANLPVPSDRLIRVELYGTIEGEGEVMLGCERVQINADGITIMNIGPQRSDGPADCSG